MNAFRLGIQLKALREQPHWRLLAADNAPWIMALFSSLFEGEQRRVPASILLERLRRDRQELELSGEFALPNAAQRYLSEWVDRGWLSRRLPAG